MTTNLKQRAAMAVLALLGATCRLSAADPEPKPITPTSVIALFNGKDLSGFYTWLTTTRYEDPDRVFSVVDAVDGAPALRISGQHFGGLITKQSYSNYRLVAEYRWGPVTWAPRHNKARDTGFLLHCFGPDGNRNVRFNSAFMGSIEFQIIEGGTGDILLLPGYVGPKPDLIPARLTVPVNPGSRIWNPSSPAAEFTSGRIDWQYRDPAWKDVLGFRGPKDLEKAVGEWNRIEALCDGGNVTFWVNGTKANAGTSSNLTAGKLLIQSEGAEVYFRRIELHPLSPHAAKN